MHDIASNFQSLTFGGSTKAWSGRHRRSETYMYDMYLYETDIIYIICRNRYVMLIYYIYILYTFNNSWRRYPTVSLSKK